MTETRARQRPAAVNLTPAAEARIAELMASAPAGAIGVILTRLGYRIHGVDKKLFKTGLVRIHAQGDCRFNDYLAVI